MYHSWCFVPVVPVIPSPMAAAGSRVVVVVILATGAGGWTATSGAFTRFAAFTISTATPTATASACDVFPSLLLGHELFAERLDAILWVVSLVRVEERILRTLEDAGAVPQAGW